MYISHGASTAEQNKPDYLARNVAADFISVNASHFLQK